MAVSKNTTDDFFNLMEKEQKIENPFATDEVLFRDESGELKVLKGGEIGEVLDFDQKSLEAKVPHKPQKKPTIAVREKTVSPKPPLISHLPIKELTKPKATKPVSQPLNLDKEIETIIKKSGFKLSDPAELKKFKSIISSHFKGIRDRVQTKEALIGPPLVGGLGLDSAIVDRILSITEEEIEKLDGRLREEVSEEPFSDLRAEVTKILKEPLVTESPVEPPTIIFKPERKKESVKEAVSIPPPLVKEPLPKAPPPVKMERPPIVSSDFRRPKIEDVKFEPRLLGPIEEIGAMTLTDFRRLAPTSAEAIEKLIEKIELLEEESFSKKIAAIRAWKENEVSRLYLRLGDESMEQKKSIAEIITQKQQANQPTLTEEEVEAIIELNQRLRH